MSTCTLDVDDAIDADRFLATTADGEELELLSVDDNIADRDAWVDGKPGGTRKHFTFEAKREDGVYVFHGTITAPRRSDEGDFELSVAKSFTESGDEEPIDLADVEILEDD